MAYEGKGHLEDEDIKAYDWELLEPAESKLVEDHLNTCTTCSRVAVEMGLNKFLDRRKPIDDAE